MRRGLLSVYLIWPLSHLCEPILSPRFSYLPTSDEFNYCLLINGKSFCRSLRDVMRLQKSL